MAKSAPDERSGRFGCGHLLLVAGAAALVAALGTVWWVKHNVYASLFAPTELSAREREVLETKLELLQEPGKPAGKRERRSSSPPLAPEPYSEEGADREVRLTEKELNGLIAEDVETARRVAIDLADDLVSVKLVVPVDEEFPVLGGKRLKLRMGVTLAYEEGRPVVALRGVSLGGVPLPNAWLGNIKNRNLVEEFGSETGFWKIFADGVEDLAVREGSLRIRLRE